MTEKELAHIGEIFRFTWNKIKSENDQISRDFCLLVLSWETASEGKLNLLLVKGNAKGSNQKGKIYTCWLIFALYNNSRHVAFIRINMLKSPKERNLTLLFSWILFDLMYLSCCRIRFCNNRPVACPHVYLPDCQRRLSRQVYVMVALCFNWLFQQFKI